MATAVFAYTAFVIDAFAGKITGWECSTSKEKTFVSSAIRQAAAARAWEGKPLLGNTIHHSGAGSQGANTSVRFADSLLLAGMIPSIGTVGDAYDNAFAETMIGLQDRVHPPGSPLRTGPFNRLSDLEEATAAWAHW